jgi:hypothetical protein
MKPKRALTRQLRCESLEGRLVLSVVPGLPTAAAIPHAVHNTSAAAVAKATVAPISSVSSNWSGYAVTGSSVTNVAGSWVVPTVSTSTSGYSAVWVGIDGYSSSTVEQIGTGEDVVNGKASYYAWYEMYPSGSVTIATTNDGTTPFTVKPGDSITASVAYTGSNDFVLTIADGSESFTTTQTATAAAMSSAEWIVEAPSSNRGVLPLANFGSVTFTNAYATINGTTGAIDNWQSHAINIESVFQVEATTGALTDTAAPSSDGFTGNVSSFTVTDGGSSPSPTPTPTPTPPSGHHHGWGGWGGWGGGSSGGWGGWGWAQTDLASQVTVGQSGASSHSSSAGHAGRDYLFASSDLFDLLRLRV